MENIVLVCSEGRFEFPHQFVHLSKFVKHATEDFPGEINVNIPIRHLELIKEYCDYHKYQSTSIPRPVSGKPFSQIFPDEFDQSFLQRLQKSQILSPLLLTCVFLDIECLLDLFFAYIAWSQTSTPLESQISRYNISSSFTELEDSRILQQNPWSNKKHNNQ